MEPVRRTFDEDDFWEQVREIEATGGWQLEDFIAELEAIVNAPRATPPGCDDASPA